MVFVAPARAFRDLGAKRCCREFSNVFCGHQEQALIASAEFVLRETREHNEHKCYAAILPLMLVMLYSSSATYAGDVIQQ